MRAVMLLTKELNNRNLWKRVAAAFNGSPTLIPEFQLRPHFGQSHFQSAANVDRITLVGHGVRMVHGSGFFYTLEDTLYDIFPWYVPIIPCR